MNNDVITGKEITKKRLNPRLWLAYIQEKIASCPSAYLAYCFLIPVAVMYLIYLAMEIHPFGNGSVLVLDLNGQYVYFFEALRNTVYGQGSLLYSFFRGLGGEFMGMYAYYLASALPAGKNFGGSADHYPLEGRTLRLLLWFLSSQKHSAPQ